MLTVPPTIPSRCTMRGGGGSSTVGAGNGAGMAGVAIGVAGGVFEVVVAGGSVGGAAIAPGFSTTEVTGVGWAGTGSAGTG